MTRARPRRWDLAALALLLLFPGAWLGVNVVRLTDVRAPQQALYAELRALAAADGSPPVDPERARRIRVGAAALTRLAQRPFDDDARADIDAVLAGDRAPWELAASTREQLAARDHDVGELVALSNDSEWVGGTEAPPRLTFVDLGRHLALASVDARSRGKDDDADAICLAGFILVAHWPVHGDLTDVLDADALGERLWRRCADEMRVDRAVFSGLDLPTADGARAARRQAALSALRLHLLLIGPLPADVPPLRFAQHLEPSAGVVQRLALADTWRNDVDCLASPRPQRRRAAGSIDVCRDFDVATQQATAALHRRRLERALVIGRLALEEVVADTGRWPSSLAALTAGRDALAAVLQDPITHAPFDLVVHEPWATLMAVGEVAQSVRATRPELSPERDAPPPTAPAPATPR